MAALRFAGIVAALATAALIIMLAAFQVLASKAFAHDAPTGWRYPFACCANYDCKEVPDKAISEPSDSDPDYVVNETGERIGFGDKRIRNSPDGRFHWCAHRSGIDAGKTICLFVPPRGF